MRRFGVIGLLFAIACAALWLVIRQPEVAPQPIRAQPETEPFAHVSLGDVKTMPLPVHLIRSGEVVAARRFLLAPRSSGRLTELGVRPGDRLVAGALITSLAAPELTQARAQAAAELDAVKADLTDAEGDLVRARSLAKSRAVSEDDLRKADRAMAAVAAAQAALAAREADLAELRVSAPETVVVLKRLRDPGDLAGPTLPILEVQSATGLRFEAWVPLDVSASLHADMPAELVIEGSERPVPVRVTRILDAADPLTRTRKLEVDIPANAGLMAGAYGEIHIPLGETPATVVPAEALVERAGVVGVFVLEKDDQAQGERAQEDRVRYRSVRTGRRFARDVEVLAGVVPGETVVLHPDARLLDGTRVTVHGQ